MSAVITCSGGVRSFNSCRDIGVDDPVYVHNHWGKQFEPTPAPTMAAFI